MLIDFLTSYCDKTYKKQKAAGACSVCTHDWDNCPNSCEDCLRQVHYHHSDGRNDYNCDRIVNFYVCRYSNKYSSEIGYALENKKILKEFEKFNILSIGCGPAPDLMAFEIFNKENNNVPITYWGFDKNKFWEPIHNQIISYSKGNNIDTKFFYRDAIKYCDDGNRIKNMNVLILQYVVSHFVNTNQFHLLPKFFEDLTKHIVVNMLKKSLIIINDTNHYQLGRDDFIKLAEVLRENDMKFKLTRKYFDFNINNPNKVFGTPYPSTDIIYDVSKGIKDYYCSPRDCCSSVQLIIELG